MSEICDPISHHYAHQKVLGGLLEFGYYSPIGGLGYLLVQLPEPWNRQQHDLPDPTSRYVPNLT